MNLFQALPALRQHPRLKDKTIALIGVSTIVHDDEAYYFEIAKPKYWKPQKDGSTSLGIGTLGGSIKKHETVTACLRREVEEEIGARVRLEIAKETSLIDNWQIVDTLYLKPSKKRPAPWAVILLPPRLGGPNTPDHLTILSFNSRLYGQPVPGDIFGLLRIESSVLTEFFARDTWSMEEIRSFPGLSVILKGQLPENPLLSPILTARAFQLLSRSKRNA
jgi:hypothetical protein